jgi:hypothetical protein
MTTIDLTIREDEDSQVRKWFKGLMTQINELDSVLDASADAASGGKRKYTNELITKTEGDWKTPVMQIVEQLREMSPEQLAGVFNGMVRTLNTEFKESVDKWVEEQVKLQPKVEADPLDEEKKKEVQTLRADLAKQAKTLIEMAYTFGEAKGDPDNEPDPNWPLPRIRRGSIGKRGPRALTLFTWSIDGNEVENEKNTPRGVASLLGFEKASDFTKELKRLGVNTTSPENEFTVTINGKEVSAKQELDDEDEENDETDDEDSDDTADE